METSQGASSRPLASLNLVRASEAGHEFELKNSAGDGLGVFITVLGDHSDTVMAANRKLINERRERAYVAAKKGEKMAPDPIEDEEARAIEGAVLRTLAWRGIDEPCTPDHARLLYTINPEARGQVYAAAAETANFLAR
ncbi:hypothetical protein BKK81_23545 [Cupriavidus sp. USMAHM13]|uniref:Uncharacterized protein n=1 Tax=Cupriavidus malaysiensis TaxID=367825 RepID=A0A1D9IE64_9BURK|nr:MULTISPECIES: hypothetical protein [Cupriavidus]AOZ02260.1 hypothetical protein BKK81_23545 [Cupriavidus sp. USMAHM13]AOZ10361.1 hypothetical protein BKK80_32765 [Cupriavidus malaysiensis]